VDALRRSTTIAAVTWLAIVTASLGSVTAAQLAGRRIWLLGIDPVAAHHLNWPDPDREDYAGMFTPDAPWQRAAANVKVFKITGGVVLHMPEDVVSRIFTDLRRRHIELAIEMGLLAGSSKCGAGVEGYAAPRTFDVVAQKIKVLGGDLRYVAMDEPLWYGHRFSGPNACHASIADLVNEIASGVAALKRIFPDVEVGDIEPVGNPEATLWPEDIREWLKAYRDAVGQPLPFFHADIVWTGPWREQLPTLAAEIRASEARFGVIYNGDGQDQSDEAWTRHAAQRVEDVEENVGLVPDDAILQSWMPYPLHMLPETRQGTMTNLVNQYAAQLTRLTAQRSGETISGRLTGVDRKPLPGASIRVTATDNGATPITNVRIASGTVPAQAASATIALRINTECQCDGVANVGFGPIHYTDGGTQAEIERNLGQQPGHRIIVHRGEKFGQNTPTFPVHSGTPYMAQVPMQVSNESSGSGYVAIIFLDQHNVQVGNNQIRFEPSMQQAGAVFTDEAGFFSFLPDPEIRRLRASYMVEFFGNERQRYCHIFVH
jgi:hypothetical protein